jgi:hypothetical protein
MNIFLSFWLVTIFPWIDIVMQYSFGRDDNRAAHKGEFFSFLV